MHKYAHRTQLYTNCVDLCKHFLKIFMQNSRNHKISYTLIELHFVRVGGFEIAYAFIGYWPLCPIHTHCDFKCWLTIQHRMQHSKRLQFIRFGKHGRPLFIFTRNSQLDCAGVLTSYWQFEWKSKKKKKMPAYQYN